MRSGGLITRLTFKAHLFCNSGICVNLTSTLKQDSFCPDEVEVTFTCTAIGFDLQWRINNKTIYYNQKAKEENIQRLGQFNATFDLLRRVILGEEDYGQRVSVCHVARPYTNNTTLTVECLNGGLPEEKTFLPKVLGMYACYIIIIYSYIIALFFFF